MKLNEKIKSGLTDQNIDKICYDGINLTKTEISKIYTSTFTDLFTYLKTAVSGSTVALGLNALITKSSSIINNIKNFNFNEKIKNIFTKIPEDLL